MNPDELPPPAQLMKFIVGRWISKPIYAAAELGIADILADGPKTIERLAAKTKTHAPSLYRVLRALAGVGIFREDEDRTFSLTPMGECLKTGALRSAAVLFNAEYSDKAWEHFLDSVRTGETAFDKAHGMPLAEWLAEHPDAARTFNEANAVKASSSHRAVVDRYDFRGIDTITDVGGGVGALVSEILRAHPAMRAIVADMPHVQEEAEACIRARDLRDRCEFVACDFFRDVPSGSDAYLLSHILHDWPDDKCLEILRNCRRAMTAGSRLLVVEMLIPPGNAPSVAKLLDLEMMVMTGGRERTGEEYESLLREAGFSRLRTITTSEGISILEAVME